MTWVCVLLGLADLGIFFTMSEDHSVRITEPATNPMIPSCPDPGPASRCFVSPSVRICSVKRSGLNTKNRSNRPDFGSGCTPNFPGSWETTAPPEDAGSVGQAPGQVSQRPAGTTMSNSHLPAEMLDHVVDHLHDARDALRNCCLVSKSWVPRARKHLFADIWFPTATRIQS